MKLSAQEIESGLQALPGWSHDPSAAALRRSFKFRDFGEAFGFMTRVALAAEKAITPNGAMSGTGSTSPSPPTAPAESLERTWIWRKASTRSPASLP